MNNPAAALFSYTQKPQVKEDVIPQEQSLFGEIKPPQVGTTKPNSNSLNIFGAPLSQAQAHQNTNQPPPSMNIFAQHSPSAKIFTQQATQQPQPPQMPSREMSFGQPQPVALVPQTNSGKKTLQRTYSFDGQDETVPSGLRVSPIEVVPSEQSTTAKQEAKEYLKQMDSEPQSTIMVDLPTENIATVEDILVLKDEMNLNIEKKMTLLLLLRKEVCILDYPFMKAILVSSEFEQLRIKQQIKKIANYVMQDSLIEPRTAIIAQRVKESTAAVETKILKAEEEFAKCSLEPIQLEWRLQQNIPAHQLYLYKKLENGSTRQQYDYDEEEQQIHQIVAKIRNFTDFYKNKVDKLPIGSIVQSQYKTIQEKEDNSFLKRLMFQVDQNKRTQVEYYVSQKYLQIRLTTSKPHAPETAKLVKPLPKTNLIYGESLEKLQLKENAHQKELQRKKQEEEARQKKLKEQEQHRRDLLYKTNYITAYRHIPEDSDNTSIFKPSPPEPTPYDNVDGYLIAQQALYGLFQQIQNVQQTANRMQQADMIAMQQMQQQMQRSMQPGYIPPMTPMMSTTTSTALTSTTLQPQLLPTRSNINTGQQPFLQQQLMQPTSVLPQPPSSTRHKYGTRSQQQ